MKYTAGLFAMMSMLTQMHSPNKYETQEINEKNLYKKPVPIIPRGHKKFMIEGQEIWALNYKNAQRKFNHKVK